MGKSHDLATIKDDGLTVDNGNGNFVYLATDGAIEIRKSGGGGYIDFHGTAIDYDARIQNFGNGLEFNVNGAGTAIKAMDIDSSGRVMMPYQAAAFGKFTSRTTSATNYVVGIESYTARGGMSVASNRITVPVDGYYLVQGQQLITTTGSNYFNVRHNGTTKSYAYVNSDDTEDTIVQCIMNLSANDYVDFYHSFTTYTWSATHSGWLVALLG